MVEQCSLGDTSVTLHDLNTEEANVISTFNSWVGNLVRTYGFEAVRIDTVKHVRKDFWPQFVENAGVYSVGEVLDGNPDYVAAYQKESMDSVFNYPVYFPLVTAFNSTSGDINRLKDMIATVDSKFQDPTLLGSFLDNHDNPRFENTVSDKALIRNAATYPFVTDGIPYLYYGQEQGFTGGQKDYQNREPMWTSEYKTDTDGYKLFTKLNAARAAVGKEQSDFYKSKASVATSNANDIAIQKGNMLSVLTNRGSNAETSTLTVPTTFEANADILDVIGCQAYKTDGDKSIKVNIAKGEPVVLIPMAYDQDKKICSSTNGGSGGGDSGKPDNAALAGTAIPSALVAAGMIVAGSLIHLI